MPATTPSIRYLTTTPRKGGKRRLAGDARGYGSRMLEQAGGGEVWFVQLKFARAVAEAGHAGWVTVAASASAREAGREAAFSYRNLQHPDAGFPRQLRIRREHDLRRQEGDAAVDAAYKSLRALADDGWAA
jgi:hypothetical protein